MAITTEMIKQLRELTQAGVLDCKRALEENDGDFEKAAEYLKQKGLAAAAKKADRAAVDGRIEAYVHPGDKLAAMVEVNCESDFVAKSENFVAFVKDVAMHIAAANPDWVSRDDVPNDVLDKEKEILKEQALKSGKPEKVIEKIIEGRLTKFYAERCLLDQPFVKDTDKTIKQLLDELMAKTGEKCVVKRFTRYQLGEEI